MSELPALVEGGIHPVVHRYYTRYLPIRYAKHRTYNLASTVIIYHPPLMPSRGRVGIMQTGVGKQVFLFNAVILKYIFRKMNRKDLEIKESVGPNILLVL